jgi:hypothetical protein
VKNTYTERAVTPNLRTTAIRSITKLSRLRHFAGPAIFYRVVPALLILLQKRVKVLNGPLNKALLGTFIFDNLKGCRDSCLAAIFRVRNKTLQQPFCIFTLILASACISSAHAACGQHKLPSYGDIDAIRYEVTNCFGKCPSYQVLFTKEGDCYYVGMRYVSDIGTYAGACSAAALKRAIAVLKRYDFYKLNYDSAILVLDAPHYIVSAERCGVTTIFDWPAYENRMDIISLLHGLDRVKDEVRWHKISSSLQSPLADRASIP